MEVIPTHVARRLPRTRLDDEEVHLVKEEGVAVGGPLAGVGVTIAAPVAPPHARHAPLLVPPSAVAGEVPAIARAARVTEVARAEERVECVSTLLGVVAVLVAVEREEAVAGVIPGVLATVAAASVALPTGAPLLGAVTRVIPCAVGAPPAPRALGRDLVVDGRRGGGAVVADAAPPHAARLPAVDGDEIPVALPVGD